MRCPHCKNLESKVVDSRPTEDGKAIRRRRECADCEKRFTTYEKVEETPLLVIKKDGNRQAFDRDKVLSGIIKSCEKRPVPLKSMEEIVDSIEKEFKNCMETEVGSHIIGERVMEKLRKLDEIAYIRFASVYRQFTDVNSFIQELEKLLNNKNS